MQRDAPGRVPRAAADRAAGALATGRNPADRLGRQVAEHWSSPDQLRRAAATRRAAGRRHGGRNIDRAQNAPRQLRGTARRRPEPAGLGRAQGTADAGSGAGFTRLPPRVPLAAAQSRTGPCRTGARAPRLRPWYVFLGLTLSPRVSAPRRLGCGDGGRARAGVRGRLSQVSLSAITEEMLRHRHDSATPPAPHVASASWWRSRASALPRPTRRLRGGRHRAGHRGASPSAHAFQVLDRYALAYTSAAYYERDSPLLLIERVAGDSTVRQLGDGRRVPDHVSQHGPSSTPRCAAVGIAVDISFRPPPTCVRGGLPRRRAGLADREGNVYFQAGPQRSTTATSPGSAPRSGSARDHARVAGPRRRRVGMAGGERGRREGRALATN